MIDGALQSMLHAVAKIKIGFSNLMVWHLEDRLDVLRSKTVAFHTLECLGTTNQSLDVVGIDLQDGRTVRNDAVKVGDLLVAS